MRRERNKKPLRIPRQSHTDSLWLDSTPSQLTRWSSLWCCLWHERCRPHSTPFMATAMAAGHCLPRRLGPVPRGPEFPVEVLLPIQLPKDYYVRTQLQATAVPSRVDRVEVWFVVHMKLARARVGSKRLYFLKQALRDAPESARDDDVIRPVWINSSLRWRCN